MLKGVISQRLVPRADGKGMIPAVEILVNTARVRELIDDPKRTREIHDAIATGRDPYGMISFDQSLTDLVQQQLVTYEEALAHATNPDDFALTLPRRQQGRAVSLDGARPAARRRDPRATPVRRRRADDGRRSTRRLSTSTASAARRRPDVASERDGRAS